MKSQLAVEQARRAVPTIRTLDHGTLGEEDFHRMIALERRRTTRSQKSFLLMLLDVGENAMPRDSRMSLARILSALPLITRETDITGWYSEDAVVGVMFTEIVMGENNSVPPTLMARVSETMRRQLTAQQFHRMNISFHVLPGALEPSALADALPAIYPALVGPPQ